MEKCIENVINSKPGEEVKMLVRKHWLVFAAMSASLFFILVLPLVVLFTIGHYLPIIYTGIYGSVLIAAAFAYILLLMAGFLLGYIKYYFDIVIVTNKRIIDIDQVGLFNRNIEELELLHIENISATVKGALPTFFDFGDVMVETAADKDNFNFKTIPHPQEFSRKVMQLYEELISDNGENLRKVDDIEGLNRWEQNGAAVNKTVEQSNQTISFLNQNEEKQIQGESQQNQPKSQSENKCTNPDKINLDDLNKS